MATPKIGLALTDNWMGDPVVIAVNEQMEQIGKMILTTATDWGRPNLIRGVIVHPEYRRQGIATAMWDYAKQQGLQPAHDLEKTADGKAWAEAVGD